MLHLLKKLEIYCEINDMGIKRKEVLRLVSNLKDEITNTLSILLEKNLLKYYLPLKEEFSENTFSLTWNNHSSSRLNTEHHFGMVTQYKYFLECSSITAMLFDGSILKVSYTINREIFLISHNLTFWPAPFQTKVDSEDSPIDIIEKYTYDDNWINKLKMRTPMRLDFDINKIKQGHTAVHMHMQDNDCRMHILQPVCFNKFIKFIFKNFYYSLYEAESFWDDLDNTLKPFKISKWDDTIIKDDITIIWN